MTVLLSNNANSKLGSAIGATDTTLSVTTGDGVKFPALAAGQWFPVVAIKASGQREIMRCTSRSGDLLTVTRGQEGTAAQAFSAGDRVELRITAAAMLEFLQSGDSRLGAAATRAVGSANGQLPENGGGANFNTLGISAGLGVTGQSYLKRTGSYMGDWTSGVMVIDGNPDPCIVFHASGRAVAKLLGMTTDNKLVWGGNGGANYEIWHAGNFTPSSKQDALGFTPIQQGGGPGQGTNKIRIGWGADSTLKLQVDTTDFGTSWPINISGSAQYVNAESVRSAVAGFGVSEVGTYALLRNRGAMSRWAGTVVAGSQLYYCNVADGLSSGADVRNPPGTWKLMGQLYRDSDTGEGGGSLFLRIA